jgi:uncharacterized protein (TIGR03437 family)
VVTVNGQAARVLFAGRSSQYAGLDQINVELPQGVRGSAVQVQMTAGHRSSNVVTLAIQ